MQTSVHSVHGHTGVYLTGSATVSLVLDELVLDLYDFTDEERELIHERTPTPSNPLDTRVVVTD